MRYWTGFFTGASAFVVAGLLLFGISTSSAMAAMYADFGGRLPTATALVLHPAWHYGLPLFGGLCIAGLNLHSGITERRRTMFLGGFTFCLLVATFFNLWAHYAPIFAVRDAIQF